MMNMRIVFSNETVKKLVDALQKAYKAGDARQIKKITVLLDLSRGEAVSTIAERLGISRTSIYTWLRDFMVKGLAGLQPKWQGGRPSKLTPSRRSS